MYDWKLEGSTFRTLDMWSLKWLLLCKWTKWWWRSKLSITGNKDASPTYFVFMSFMQVETYVSLCVALKSKVFLTSPLIYGTKRGTLPLNMSLHIEVFTMCIVCIWIWNLSSCCLKLWISPIHEVLDLLHCMCVWSC